MRIARPPGGFRITYSPAASAVITGARTASEAFDRHWADIEARLGFTAHVEGVDLSKYAPGARLWSAAEDAERGLPRVRIVYTVVGSQVRVRMAQVG